MKNEDIPPYFHRWSDIFENWHQWLRKRDISPVDACLAFVLQNKLIDNVIVGVESAEQLEQVIEVSNSKLVEFWPSITSDDDDLVNPFFWSKNEKNYNNHR